jgi:hypothetical protein
MPNIPTKGETYSRLLEHLRYAQEDAAMMAHLLKAEADAPGLVLGQGWLNISEGLRKMQHIVTQLAKGNLQ